MVVRNSSGITTPTLTLAAGMVGFVFAGVVYVNNTYLTIREHQSFRDSVERDLGRLENSRLSKDEFETWKKERNTGVGIQITALKERQDRFAQTLDRMYSQLNEALRESAALRALLPPRR